MMDESSWRTVVCRDGPEKNGGHIKSLMCQLVLVLPRNMSEPHTQNVNVSEPHSGNDLTLASVTVSEPHRGHHTAPAQP